MITAESAKTTNNTILDRIISRWKRLVSSWCSQRLLRFHALFLNVTTRQKPFKLNYSLFSKSKTAYISCNYEITLIFPTFRTVYNVNNKTMLAGLESRRRVTHCQWDCWCSRLKFYLNLRFFDLAITNFLFFLTVPFVGFVLVTW